MRAIEFVPSTDEWVRADALRGLLAGSGGWAASFDGDNQRGWSIHDVVLTRVTDPPPGCAHVEHWLVVSAYDWFSMAEDDDVCVIPLSEVDTLTF